MGADNGLERMTKERLYEIHRHIAHAFPGYVIEILNDQAFGEAWNGVVSAFEPIATHVAGSFVAALVADSYTCLKLDGTVATRFLSSSAPEHFELDIVNTTLVELVTERLDMDLDLDGGDDERRQLIATLQAAIDVIQADIDLDKEVS